MQIHIYLSEDDIQKLINGETVAINRGMSQYMPDRFNDFIYLHKDISYIKEMKFDETCD